ncbi:MAG: tRNA (adenosine(37)-N6)-dimethylallyltransferase MiaA [Planctomycetes bacterium]|nr:tRNA (adenosine(37)-N6)-dimethylallyltransferase MiaA [Planctomycetota bacterium]
MSAPAPQILRFLIGPTAVGKSAAALALGEATGCELVSLDSMQVYRGMDIGTAKPSAAERARVPHHMLDLVGPQERFDVQRFLRELEPISADLERRGVRALFVGGTGFYLKALTHGLFEGPEVDRELRARLEQRYASEGAAVLHAELARADPASAARIHANDRKRLLRAVEVFEQTGRALSDWQREWGWHGADATPRAVRIAGLGCPMPELERRIRARTRAMLAAGWVEEARALRESPGFGPTAIQALGYAEVLALADGTLAREACEERIARATRQFARRQHTWWRKLDARWFPVLPESSSGEPSADRLEELARALEL